MNRLSTATKSVICLSLLAACASPGLRNDPPAAPTNVSAALVEDAVQVTWEDESASETGFNVYRETLAPEGAATDGFELVGQTDANETTYLDTAIQGGASYRYAVSAFDLSGESALVEQGSDPVETPPGSPAPDPDPDPEPEPDPDPNLILVTTDDPGIGGPDCTLRDALTAANTDTATGGCPAGDGDDRIELEEAFTITFDAADNGGNALPVITSVVTVAGNGSTLQRGEEAPEFRLFTVQGSLTLEDMTVRNGHGGMEGGGGILVSGGALSLNGVTVADNVVAYAEDVRGGGLYSLSGTVEITASEFRGNDITGGALEPDRTDGAAIAIDGGSLSLTDTDLTLNVGGAAAVIHVFGDDTHVAMTGGSIVDNGASILRNEGHLEMTGVHIAGNGFSGGPPGANNLANSGVAVLTGVTVTGHTGTNSATVVNSGDLTLKESSVTDNSNGEMASAGGIANGSGATMTIVDSVISGNEGPSDWGAGGIFNAGTLDVRGSQIQGNRSGSTGGGIWNEGTFALTDTVVDDNSAVFGGGIWTDSDATLAGTTSIGAEGSGNQATVDGGGIFADGTAGPVTIYLSGTAQVVGNTAGTGDAGIHEVGDVTLDDSACDPGCTVQPD